LTTTFDPKGSLPFGGPKDPSDSVLECLNINITSLAPKALRLIKIHIKIMKIDKIYLEVNNGKTLLKKHQ
jgi:hypothetical protein